MSWIAVGERMPDADKLVLIYGKNELGNGRTLRARWCPKGVVESSCDDELDASEYDEAQDQYFLCEGWYESNEFDEVNWKVCFPVTHWMPLPAPPSTV